VRDASRMVRSTHMLSDAGYHTLKIWMVDPAVVLEKIMVDSGGLKPSYLGPPESYHHGEFFFRGSLGPKGAPAERVPAAQGLSLIPLTRRPSPNPHRR